MSTSLPPSPPSPERLFNTINAFQQTEALRAAIDLDLFTAIGQGHTTSAALARHLHASERGLRILCDFLTIHGFLSKQGASYALAPDTAVFLHRGSPAYMGSVADFLTSDRHRDAHRRLRDAVRQGGCAQDDAPFDPDDPNWVLFAHAMMPMMRMPAEVIASTLAAEAPVHHVLDIAAGHGAFGIAIARHNPDAQIYAVDWPKVLDVAEANAAAAGVADRFHTLPGSAFDVPFGDGFDLALVTNFLHHFDVPTCTSFLRKVHAALAPGGRAAVLEFVPNDDRVTPPSAASFSLIMLASTPAGDAYTFAELESMSLAAGFSRVTRSPVPLGAETLLVAHK